MAQRKRILIPQIQYSKNKGFAEDLTEGKFSFPVVHGVRADVTNRQILSVSYLLHGITSF